MTGADVVVDQMTAETPAQAASCSSRFHGVDHAPVKALLLDMDGVLAEVALSYRMAIVQTAKRFGVDVTLDEIEQLKIAGNANNDWKLTLRIVQSKKPHCDATLDQVTKVFEEIYQGTDTTPGLCLLESLIPAKGLLEELHRRLPHGMGIVTGRPLKDCDTFLQTHGLDKLFPVRVCMDDCPPKPSPKPVLLALQELGVEACDAVMVGDTVDDVLAAVGANTRAFGVLTPHGYAKSIVDQKPADMERVLEQAGATVVLKPGLAELLDLIPPSELVQVRNDAASLLCSPRRRITREQEKEDVATNQQQQQQQKQQQQTADSRSGRRTATVQRVTSETSIQVSIDLDGTGVCQIDSGVGFLDHMLAALSKHARFDLSLSCKGDLWIDDHHSVEDCALALGEAFDSALGNRAGITRFGFACVPLDETLARAVVDISSRPCAEIHLNLVRPMIGTLSCEMLPHFFQSFAQSARLSLHVDVIRGANDHHRAEASFKALAVALRQAVARDDTAGIPSTKGLLA